MTIDDQLAQLRDLATGDLTVLDGAQLAATAQAERTQGRLMLTGAGVTALFVGVAGSALTLDRAEATVVPFGAPAALAPLVQLGRG